MDISTLLLALIVVVAVTYYRAQSRSYALAPEVGGVRYLNSLPFYYGMQAALMSCLPAIGVLLLWLIFDDSIINAMVLAQLPVDIQALPANELGLVMNSIGNIAAGAAMGDVTAEYQQAADTLNALKNTSSLALGAVCLSVACVGAIWGWMRVSPTLHARTQVEKVFTWLLMGCSMIAILTTVGIVFSVLFESLQFFQHVSPLEFLFSPEWSPQMAIRADQAGASGAFGAIPLFAGTMMITVLAMMIAVPVGLMSAIYLAEYANKRFRSVAKPILEILAGIPTVVYGFFAALTVAPWVRDLTTAIDETLGMGGALAASSESALAAGMVMGIMIIPFVSSLSDDVITAVPQSLRDGSYGLGATKSETVRQVIIPAALPGIVGGIMLAVSRAIGETMIVVMAAGLAANLTANPLDSVTTVTVQIVTLLVGDQEFDSPKTLAAFALGLLLFVVTLTLNFIALHVVKKYREQYD
ncbi:MAG: phosphate ABC transporter permease subunit PstC [Cellvibrionaceae bacterium]